MKSRIIFTSFLLLLVAGSIFSQTKTIQELSGPYFGQKLPGTTSEIFAPEIVSTGLDELLIAFTPEGTECFWTVFFTGFETILTSRLENGKWTKPEVASFSGKYYDGWPTIQPDGKRIFFHSNRPAAINKESAAKINIWYVDKEVNGWSEPKMLGAPVNGKENSVCPSVTKDGTIYLSKRYPDGTEKIVRFRFVKGNYLEMEELPAKINISKYNFHAYVAPDESYIIYPTDNRPDIIGGGWNYYVSFRSRDDKWSELINIGKAVNSDKASGAPSISADGKYFFFQAKTKITFITELEKKHTLKELIERENRIPGMRNNDIYWIETSVIEQLRPPEFK